jgi:hypothetical protein
VQYRNAISSSLRLRHILNQSGEVNSLGAPFLKLKPVDIGFGGNKAREDGVNSWRGVAI